MEVGKLTDPGAPYAYLPMTLQQPLFTEAILARQREIEGNSWSWKLHELAREVPRHSDTPPMPEGFAPNDAPPADEPPPSHPQNTPPLLSKAMRDAIQLACMQSGALTQEPSPCTIKTSDTHPIQVSPILPPSQLEALSEQVFAHLPPEYIECTHADVGHGPCGYLHRGKQIPPGEFASHLVHTLEEPEAHLCGQIRGEQLVRLPPTIALDDIAREAPPGCKDCPQTDAPLGPRRIGNMILSSCPGTKVRLNGPERGRSSVCRDLRMDLARYRSMGVRAIVCCLDDDELKTLGSPCSEYVEEVSAAGLDLVRLPIAEGFAPTDLVKFDIMITALILTYTLRGASILVHCRGGVGRAGLVAAIWVLKMGFVSPHTRAVPLNATLTEAMREAQCDSEAVLQTVLKLIEVVRRRRSLRAIETAEQARFLMEYVRFIHRQEHARRCVERCCGKT